MSQVHDLLKEIREGLTQTSSSSKDEERVMRAMLNDKEYKVGVYAKEGKIGEYCPAEDARDMISSVIASTTKISQEEAKGLADSYEFKKSEATSMVNISKEFVNTYLETERKLPLGGRETSNVQLSRKHIEESTKNYPSRVGVDSSGNPIYGTTPIKVNAHDSVKVHAKCPDWLK